jgi:uncharacterized membrane protein YhaH (DUF805 family)
MRWALLPYRRYFEFRGRSRRTEYWAFALGWLIAWTAFGFVGTLLGRDGVPGADVLAWLFLLASLIPGLAVTARRLHDANRTGWWAALPFTPFFFALVLVPFGDETTESMSEWIGLTGLVCPLILLVMLAWKGTSGPNRFGADPRNPDADLEAVFS